MAALLGLAVHAYCLRPRALPWPFFRPAGPGEPLFEARACSCYRCQFAVEGRLLAPADSIGQRNRLFKSLSRCLVA